MSRSLRKGPYIQEALEKRILAMNNGSKKKEVVKTWSRASMISFLFTSPNRWWATSSASSPLPVHSEVIQVTIRSKQHGKA